MRNFQILSDISFFLALVPKLEPSMTPEMEEKFSEILRGELTMMNVYVESAKFEEDYHLFKFSSPPEMSPLATATLVMDKVTQRFLQHFDELEGWGSIYHDRVYIKTGPHFSKRQLDDMLNISLSDI